MSTYYDYFPDAVIPPALLVVFVVNSFSSFYSIPHLLPIPLLLCGLLCFKLLRGIRGIEWVYVLGIVVLNVADVLTTLDWASLEAERSNRQCSSTRSMVYSGESPSAMARRRKGLGITS